MKVIAIRRRGFLDNYSRSREVVPEGVRFLTGVGLTLLAPTLLYCAIVGSLWPLYLMACNGALGVALGVLMFKKPAAGFLSCLPATNVPSGAGAGRLKHAA